MSHHSVNYFNTHLIIIHVGSSRLKSFAIFWALVPNSCQKLLNCLEWWALNQYWETKILNKFSDGLSQDVSRKQNHAANLNYLRTDYRHSSRFQNCAMLWATNFQNMVKILLSSQLWGWARNEKDLFIFLLSYDTPFT